MVSLRATFLLTLACVPAAAQPGSRLLQQIVPRKQVALVVGNGAYTRFGQLKNPANDADAMARRLQQLNYDVLLVKNAGRRMLGQKIDEFIGRLGTGDVAFFYYAGHGVQVEGENYLVPVDFDGETESDVRYDAHPIGKVQDRMERSGAQLNILVLDACRNNPFRFAGRAGTRGWAAMSAGRGTFIAFATAPGNVASDNVAAENGLFTQELLAALSVPGLGLNDVFDYARERVDQVSGGKQLPWAHSSVVGRYHFVPGTEGPAAAVSAPPPPVTRPSVVTAPAPQSIRQNPKDGLNYVWIPPGRFRMGCSADDTECKDDEKPVHEVEITRGFWIGQTEVTQEAYQKVVGKDPSRFKGMQRPVERVRWDEATAYCAAAGMRLPTEAEWEYAARAGATGAGYGDLGSVAWFSGNSNQQTQPVAQKTPNAFGLHDMLGNIWEWVADWYDATYYERAVKFDPSGPSSGQYRIVRGGSWFVSARNVRASFRIKMGASAVFRFDVIGFRCAGELR